MSDHAKANLAATPGPLAPGVTVAMLARRGYATSVRPSRYHSARMKLAVMKAYGVSRLRILTYTMDHLIAIENGGDPGSVADLSNVWPQPKGEAKLKDASENAYHRAIIAGTITIDAAANLARAEWAS